MQKYQLVKYSNGYVLETIKNISDSEIIYNGKFTLFVNCPKTVADAVDFEKLNFNIEVESQMDILKGLGHCFSFMPDYTGSETFIPKIFLPKPIDDNFDLTFFGGSFNPWHPGHSECIKQCSQYENAIVVVPDYSPWKDNTFPSPLEEIIKLTKKIRSCSSLAVVYPGFWGSRDRNPTSKWIVQISESKKNWLMGEDTFETLLNWYEVGSFLNEITKLYVLPRSFERKSPTSIEEVSKYLSEHHSDLEIIWLADHPYKEIASSKIR